MTVMSYLKSSEKEHKGCGVSFMFKIKFVPFHLLSHFFVRFFGLYVYMLQNQNVL
jgi:nitrate reductase NapE component